MADIKPFQAVRPVAEKAARVAALPYDVFTRKEAQEEVKREPLSFLNIDRAETQFEESVDTYAPIVYKKAADLLSMWIKEGIFETEEMDCYYIYELTMNGRVQTGIAACASIEDYEAQVIKKHENTREDKEMDRICHVDACDAQTGPIFLAYRSQKVINDIVSEEKKKKPLYDFLAEDGVKNTIWRIDGEEAVEGLRSAFSQVDSIYIADGHHRAASAVKVGQKRRGEHPGYTGEEEFNYFLSVLFPDDQLMIMEYNRVVKDLNGLTEEEFLKKAETNFFVEKIERKDYRPRKPHEIGLLLSSGWYRLTVRDYESKSAGIRPAEEKCHGRGMEDPVARLDVSLLSDYLLSPVLGIGDPRTDQRIDFIGGIRGVEELEKRVASGWAAAFYMYPTSMEELFSVADAGRLMPPKSTWFEPKLRSGLLIHKLT